MTNLAWVGLAREKHNAKTPALNYVRADHDGHRLIATDAYRLHILHSFEKLPLEDGIYEAGVLKDLDPKWKVENPPSWPDYERVIPMEAAGAWHRVPADHALALCWGCHQANRELARWSKGERFMVVLDSSRGTAYCEALYLFDAFGGARPAKGEEAPLIRFQMAGPEKALHIIIDTPPDRLEAVVMPVRMNERQDPVERLAFDLRPFSQKIAEGPGPWAPAERQEA